MQKNTAKSESMFTHSQNLLDSRKNQNFLKWVLAAQTQKELHMLKTILAKTLKHRTYSNQDSLLTVLQSQKEKDFRVQSNDLVSRLDITNLKKQKEDRDHLVVGLHKHTLCIELRMQDKWAIIIEQNSINGLSKFPIRQKK